MKGRPPKPIEQHVAEGTHRADRHGMLPVVIGERGVAQTPKNLSPAQAEIWEWLVDELATSRLLQSTDAPMLEQFVIAADAARQMRDLWMEEGIIYDEPKFNKEGVHIGDVKKQHPAYGAWLKAVQTMKQLAEQFGLTPSARTRLGIQNIVGISAAKQLERSLGINPLEVLEGEIND